MRLTDFTGADDLDMYRETGVTLTEVFDGRVSLFTIAALVWLTKRRRSPSLSFAEVNRSFSFQSFATVRQSEGAEAGPEA